jgi:hypothetical protein
MLSPERESPGFSHEEEVNQSPDPPTTSSSSTFQNGSIELAIAVLVLLSLVTALYLRLGLLFADFANRYASSFGEPLLPGS